jgi:hypothetical protein
LVKARLALPVMAMLFAIGCEDFDQRTPEEAGEVLDSGSVRDAALDARWENNAVDMFRDTDVAPEFVCSRTDQVTPRMLASEEFRIFPQLESEVVRRSDLVAEGAFNPDGTLSSTGTYLTAPPEMHGGREALRSIFVHERTDVHILGGWWTDQPVPDSARGSLTVLVNYQPVVAEYIFRGPESVEQLARYTDSGALHPMTADFMSFEVIVPGSVFDEKGVYDLAIRADAYSDGRRIATRHQRVTVFAGGYEVPAHPCFETTEYSQETGFERDNYDLVFHGSGMLYPTAAPQDWRDADGRIRPVLMRAGEAWPLTLFLIAPFSEEAKSVWVPLLNGRPVGRARFVFLPANRQVYGPAHRTEFELALLAEPGRHDLGVAQWFDPFEPRTDRFGEAVETLRYPIGGTNILPVVVTE